MTKSKKSQGASRTLRSEESLERDIEATQRLSVVPETNKRYNWKIFSMKKWLSERYGPDKVTMTTREFSLFLADGKDGKGIKNGNSGKAWRSAWNYWQQTERMEVIPSPVEEERVTRQIKGLQYAAGEGTLCQPDVIDSGRLRAMTSTLWGLGEFMYALYFILVFYGAFRKTVGSTVLVKDVRFDTDIGTVIHTARTKDAKPGNIDIPGKLHNFKEVDNLTAFLKGLVQDKEPEEPLFPGFNDAKANSLIKRMAYTHRWGEGKWVVTSLRHGASREARAVVAEVPSIPEMNDSRLGERMSRRMGHSNVRSKITYQKSNSKKK